ncbi:MAG: hypothetical protein C5B55_11025 [Blastocatellia bacterium]|nr:MAG: hypothetical protein C5B55_11025 [Blastocatellia bacterium]
MALRIRTHFPENRPELLDDFDEPQNNERIPGVRTLKPPPEIWELVHTVPSTQGLATRIATKATNWVLLIVAIVSLLFVGVIFWKLRIAPKVIAKVTTQNSRPTQVAPATVRTPVAPVKSVNPAPATELSSTELSQSQYPPINDNVVPTTSVTRKLRKRSPRSSNRVTAATVQTPAKLGAPTSAATTTNKGSIQPSNDSTAAKSKSNSTASPELISPVKPSATQKPKVIPWP